MGSALKVQKLKDQLDLAQNQVEVTAYGALCVRLLS